VKNGVPKVGCPDVQDSVLNKEANGEHSAQDRPEVQFSARVNVRFEVGTMRTIRRIQADPGLSSHNKSSQI